MIGNNTNVHGEGVGSISPGPPGGMDAVQLGKWLQGLCLMTGETSGFIRGMHVNQPSAPRIPSVRLHICEINIGVNESACV